MKPTALAMRKEGASFRSIELALKVPRSTLHEWLQNIPLTIEQKKLLQNKQYESLKKARTKAIIWHNTQKQNRLKIAQQEARNTLSTISLQDNGIQQLMLAMLYLGEGFKSKPELGIGNSNPKILQLFLTIISSSFNIDTNTIRCELYLRADQQPNKEKAYWAEKLNIPLKNFTYTTCDKRTKGIPTRENYHGVCTLRLGNSKIQRKLLAIADIACNEIGQLAQR